MVAVVNINEVLDGHVALEVECVDRLYLNVYVPILQVGRSGEAVLGGAPRQPDPVTGDHREDHDGIASGPLDTTTGSDIVAWVVVRHHHESRFDAEEATFLPYHYEGFHLTPRAFARLRPDDRQTNPERPPRDG